jgi:hypothetical protein
MSVTISIDAVPTGIFVAACYATGDAVEIVRAEGYEAAVALASEHKTVCEDCATYGILASPVMDVEGFEVNLANTNARQLGAVIDFDFGDELYGACDPADLLGAVLIALAQEHTPIAPYETTTSIFGVGPRVIDCGFDATNYLSRIADLCVEAQRLGRQVTWG